jgi:hypothetical protein
MLSKLSETQHCAAVSVWCISSILSFFHTSFSRSFLRSFYSVFSFSTVWCVVVWCVIVCDDVIWCDMMWYEKVMRKKIQAMIGFLFSPASHCLLPQTAVLCCPSVRPVCEACLTSTKWLDVTKSDVVHVYKASIRIISFWLLCFFLPVSV